MAGRERAPIEQQGSPLVADVDVAGQLVQEAELWLLRAGQRVVGLLLAVRLAANPRHLGLPRSLAAGQGPRREVFYPTRGAFCPGRVLSSERAARRI